MVRYHVAGIADRVLKKYVRAGPCPGSQATDEGARSGPTLDLDKFTILLNLNRARCCREGSW